MNFSNLSPLPNLYDLSDRLEPFPDIELKGEKVYLRLPQKKDWPAWAEVREQSRDFLKPWEAQWEDNALGKDTFLERLKLQSREYHQGLLYPFFFFEKETHQLLGGMTFSRVTGNIACMGSLGYWIGAPYTRKGYTGDALRVALVFGFHGLELHRIEAACLPHNLASRRLLEKNGFTHEGRLRKYLKIAGAWQDHELYSIIREDLETP